MPTNSNTNETTMRIRANTSDQNLVRLAHRIAVAYGDDKVHLLSSREVEQVKTGNVDIALKVLSKVPQMSAGQRLDFCDLFIGEDMSGLDFATPAILGDAYRAISDRVYNGESEQQERLDKLAARIDDLSADFANSGGMVVSQNEWPLVDTNNVADVYEGFANMLDARMADIDATQEPYKVAEMRANRQQIEAVVSDYDNAWGLIDLQAGDAPMLAERWDELYGALNRAELSEETKEKLAKYKFLDSKGAVIPQFTSGKRGDTKKYEEYEPGFRIAKDGRLASIVELARHDVAKQHVADVQADIDENALESELNEQVLTKLFEIDTADKVVQGATENPEQFTDPKYREEFINNLAQNGGEISDAGYNAAIEAQTNATAGWAARVKNKLGAAAGKIGGFFGKVFQPIKHIDKMADVRMTRRSIDKREKRIEFFTRILKGFASGFIAGALITTIATAAAAAAGVSVAMSLAAIGIVTAIGMGVIQVTRWRKAQQAAGLPTDINEFLKDKRLVASLGTSLVAVVAMCFGAGGVASAARWLGIGALGMGGATGFISTLGDARDAKMSVAESIAWAILNAGAVIGGGLAGRAVAHAGINAFNEHNPRNTIFQNENTRTELQETTTTRDTTETRLEYTQDALDNAERIARWWYRDNPEILQQRVDAIYAYNAEHGTNIDPYRAIMINGDAGGRTFDNMRLHVNNSHIDPNINDVYSHGSHRVLTDAWGRANGVSHDELNAARHLFGRDGSINPNGMDVIAKLDNMISDNNTVGYVQGRPVFTDNYFKSNDPSGWTTYTGGNAPKVENVYPSQETITTTTPVEYKTYTPAHGDGMAAFGNYTPRERLTKLRDRVGSFLDRVRAGHRDRVVELDSDKDEQPIIEPIFDEEDDASPFKPATQDEDSVRPVLEPIFDEKDDMSPFKPVTTRDEGSVRPVLEPIFDEEDDASAFKPATTRDEDSVRPVLEPIFDDEEKTPSLPKKVEIPEISLDRVFPKPLFDDDKGRLAELREKSQPQPEQIPQWRIEDMPTALPDPENRKYEPLPDSSFAMTADQAERWDNLHKQLAAIRAEMRKPSTRADKFLKLRKEADRLTNEINRFAAELGHPSTFAIEQALAEVERRKKLQGLLKQIEKHMQREPKGLKWETEYQKLLDKIADLGGADSLDDSNLRFAAPTLGRSEQKRADVAQREKERQEQKHDVFVIPMREQPEQPEVSGEELTEIPTFELTTSPLSDDERPDVNGLTQERVAEVDTTKKTETEILEPIFPEEKKEPVLPPTSTLKTTRKGNPELMPRYLMKVRGIPVRFVDLTGNGEAIVQHGDRAVVVIDVDGLRIPFFLAKGNEGSKYIVQGKWYPAFEFYANGDWFLGATKSYLEAVNDRKERVRQAHKIPYLKEIAGTLDRVIGNVGSKSVAHVNPENTYAAIDHNPNNISDTIFWQQGGGRMNSYPPFVKGYFERIRAYNYSEEEERQDERRERHENRQENRDFRRQNMQKFYNELVSGVGNFAGRIRGRLFGWDEDSKEYE